MTAPTRHVLLRLPGVVLSPGDVQTVGLVLPEEIAGLDRLSGTTDRCVTIPLTGAADGVNGTGDEAEPPEVGVLARVVSRSDRPGGGGTRVVIQGLGHCHLGAVERADGCLWASARALVPADEEGGREPENRFEVSYLARRLEAAALPEAAERVLRRELERLRNTSPTSQESARLRDYLEWSLDLPWKREQRHPRFEDVATALAKSHVGLDDVKQRIAEFLAVRQLGGGARGTVLCFVGPPGTGKSSMGRAVASALGRPVLTIPVGAMVHERELVGVSHRRDGATPGAILGGVYRCGASDPVILLDEIDKLSLGGEGGAAGALLHVLDAELNSEFLDHYLGIPFDLSRCVFLATANDTENIPEALIDRMEIIEFNGYTESEKYSIANQHLLPRARRHAGIDHRRLKITPAAMRTILRDYTEEAGVRHLQRLIMSLARKAAVAVVRGEAGLSVHQHALLELLGPPTVEEELRLRRPGIGVTTGLAWTSAGGALLPIEALAMPGSGRMILTGQVGDVIRESVQTALSYVRTCFHRLGLRHEVIDEIDLHIHFPSAATPKDGPSAGIAIATALVSLLTGRPARHDVALTGELSLLGQVLPVGGLREKLLAAIRGGLPRVIVPARNHDDLRRLPAEIRDQVEIDEVEDVQDVFEKALLERPVRSWTTSFQRTTRRRSARRRRRGTG